MIKAFVGHSFDPEDKSIIIAFKKMFDSFKKSMAFIINYDIKYRMGKELDNENEDEKLCVTEK